MSHPVRQMQWFLIQLQVKQARDRLDPAYMASRAMEEAAYETYMLQGEHELK